MPFRWSDTVAASWQLPSNDLSPAVTSGPECDELSLSIVDSASLLKRFIEVQQKKVINICINSRKIRQRGTNFGSCGSPVYSGGEFGRLRGRIHAHNSLVQP